VAVTFRSAGAIGANATTTTLAVVVPASLVTNDILVISVLNKDNQVCTFPSAEADGISAWTKFVEVNNTTAEMLTLAWARVTNGANASGNTVNVTKPTDNNVLFCGVASAWIDCKLTGDPTTGAGTPTTSANALSDTVTYATFDPTIACHVVAVGVYNENLTTANGISGTNPTLTNRWDEETPTGSDGSIFGYSGDSDGAATGARSHTTSSNADAINIGCLFGLEAAPVAANLVLQSVDAVSSLSNVTIGTPLVTLDPVNVVSLLDNVLIKANAYLDLQAIGAVSLVDNLLIKANAYIACQAVDGVSNLPNIALSTPAPITLQTVDAVSSLPNLTLASPASLTLQQIDAISSLANAEIGTPLVTLQSIAGVSNLPNIEIETPGGEGPSTRGSMLLKIGGR